MSFKTTLTCFLLLLLSFPCFGQWTWVEVSPHVAYVGTSVNFTVQGTGTNFTQMDSCRFVNFWPPVSYLYGNVQVISNTLMTVSLTLPPNTTASTYIFEVWDQGSVVAMDSGTLINELLSGQAYLEGNITGGTGTNCNAGLPLVSQRVRITSLGNPVNGRTTWTDAFGHYGALLQPGPYTVSLDPLPFYYTQLCPASTVTHNLSTSGQIISNADIYYQQQSVMDVSAHLILNRHRPGFNATNYVQLINNGPVAVGNVVVKAYVNPAVNYLVSTPSGSFQNDTLTWVVPSLAGNSQMNLFFEVNIPWNTTLGTQLVYSVSAEANGDVNLSNNQDEDQTTVIGSYDPNDKQGWTQDGEDAHGHILQSDTSLRYLIRFQNTGTDTAFNIRVADYLNLNVLDASSLEILSASHPYHFLILNGGFAEFLFPDILLPDSGTNEPLSHGHIEFKIKTNGILPFGTNIFNSAQIFFDFNAPIGTNTVHSRVCPDFELSFNLTLNQSQISIANTSSGDLGTVTWDFGDGNTSSTFSPTHFYTSTGTYVVCMTNQDACGATTLCDTVAITSVGIVERPFHSLSLYPNPNQGTFNLDAELGESGPLRMRITDLMGRTLFEDDWGTVNGSLHKQLAPELPAGQYILELKLNGHRIDRKFTVQ